MRWSNKELALKNSLKRAAFVVLLFSFTFAPATTIAQTVDAPEPQPLQKVQPPLKDSSQTSSKNKSTESAKPAEQAPPAQESASINQNQADLDSLSVSDANAASMLSSGSENNVTKAKEKSTGIKAISASSDPGALEYNLPISLPPGRNGMTPDISLSYSSKNSQDVGFGYGWDIGIPSITRYNQTGFNSLYSTTSPSTTFYSTLSGELASTSATTYVARNDDGSNMQYTFTGNTWTVKDPEGNTLVFGPASSSRQDDPGGSGKIYKWMLQKATDPNGNSITYSYTKDLGQIYPSTITYTDTATTTGAFAVNFSLGLQATSTATSSLSGFPVKTRYQVNQITVQTTGTTTHSYALNYGPGDNGSRTLLKGVTETGQNSSGALSLPATNFSYSTSTAAMASTTGAYGFYAMEIFSNIDQGVATTDINGDGVVDEVQSFEQRDSSGALMSGTQLKAVYIKTSYPGYSTTSPTYITPCLNTWRSWNTSLNIVQDGGGRVVDLNGDGLADYVCGTSSYLNNGSNWVASSTWNIPVSTNVTDSSGNSVDGGVRFADVNGDGLADVIKAFSVSGTFTNTVYLNNGNGWTNSPAWVLPYHLDFTRDSGQDGGGRALDVNGDGLVDLYQGLDDSSVATSSVYINNGTGWSYDPTWILPDNIQIATTSGMVFTDINNDNLIDITIAEGYLASSTDLSSLTWTDNRVYVNTGLGWKRDLARSIPMAYKLTKDGVAYDTSPRWGNYNGSGLNSLDIGSYTNTPSPYYSGNWSTQGNIPDLLSTISESGGKKVSVKYKSTSSYTAPGFAYANPKLPYYFQVVDRIDYNDGITATTTERYDYKGGTYYFGSPTDRKFGGFANITFTDGAGNKTIDYYHTGKGTATSTGQHADNQSKIGQIYRTEYSDSSGTTLYRVIVKKWESYARNAFANFVWPTRVTQLDYDAKVTHKDSSQEFSYSTTTGALSQTISWGQVNAANDGSFSDVGTDKITTAVTYAASSTIPFKKPSRILTTDQSGNTVTDVKYFYDNLAAGSITKGNLTQQDDLKAGSTYVPTVRKVYNSLGLIIQNINARNATTTYSYDPLNLYAATTTNALGHTSTAKYNYGLGVPSELKDPNGAIERTIFDPLDRVIAILNPDINATTTLATTTAYVYTDTGMPRLTLERNYLSSTNIVDRYIYKDGFGRVVQERHEAEGTNTYKVRDTTYNSLGLVYKQSLPFFASSTAYTGTSSPAATTLLTTYLYDSLQRVTQESTYVNYLLHAYDNWKETTTDTLGKKKDYYTDSYGRLGTVVEYIGTTTATTTYAYNGLNKLTNITDASGNVRNFTYDNLGRLLKSEDLHAVGDTSFGSTTYAYDDAANITQSISPRGKVANYTYDLLNRVKTEDTPDTGYTDVIYTYDTSLHSGIGRLGNVSTAYIGTGYDYDWNGNLLAERHLIPGSATTTTFYYYDRQDNPTYVYYPDGSQVYYGYNTAGLLDNVQQIESGAPGWTPLVYNYDYSPMDQVTYTQYGNGTASLNTYTPSNLYWLASRIAYNSSQYLQYQVYTRNNEGHITAIQDASGTNSAKNLYFTYDDLYRLTSASTTNAVNGQNYKRTYSYNAIGNLLSNNGTNYLYQGNTGTNYANPHAPTSIGATTNTYDVSGNVLTNGVLSNTWDYKDRLTQSIATIGTSTATSTYTYDQIGNRITKTDPTTGTTFYANKYYTITAGGNKTKYIFANDQLLATIDTVGTTTKTYYTYSDPIESSNVVADSSGNIIEVMDYYAYGPIRLDEAATTFKTQRKYIGEYYDAASALNYLNARYYDGGRSQFLSQDPIFLGEPGDQDLKNPQSLNSYSYGLGNPISYSDPSGNVAVLALPALAYTAMEFAGYAMAGIGLYDVYVTHRQYPDQFTDQERADSRNNLVFQALTIGSGFASKYAKQFDEEKALNLSTTILDVMGAITGKDYTPRLINRGNSSGGSSSGGNASVKGVSNSSSSASNKGNTNSNKSTGNSVSHNTSRSNSASYVTQSTTSYSRGNTTVKVTTTVKTTVTISNNKITTTKTTTVKTTTSKNKKK